MTRPQRPEDDVGSRPQEKGGKKKPETESQVPATEIGKKPVSEILTQYAEQDELEGREIEDLAPAMEEDEPEEEEPAEGEEDQGEIIDQEEHGEDYEEKSPDSEEEPVTETSSGEEDQKKSDEIDEELIEGAVDKLCACVERKDNDRYEVSKGIVNDFLNGDFKAASDPNPWKTQSSKKLRDHKRLPIDPRRLRHWIRATGCREGMIVRNPEIDICFSGWLELIAIDDEDKRYGLALEVSENSRSVHWVASLTLFQWINCQFSEAAR